MNTVSAAQLFLNTEESMMADELILYFSDTDEMPIDICKIESLMLECLNDANSKYCDRVIACDTLDAIKELTLKQKKLDELVRQIFVKEQLYELDVALWLKYLTSPGELWEISEHLCNRRIRHRILDLEYDVSIRSKMSAEVIKQTNIIREKYDIFRSG